MSERRRQTLVALALVAGLLLLGLVAWAFAPRIAITPRPAPVGVWNESDEAVTIAIVGSQGERFFLVPPHQVGTIPPAPEIGPVQRLAIVDAQCGTDRFFQTFSDWSNPFSWGGSMLIENGGQGWDSQALPPFWAEPLEPLAGGCTPSR